MSSPSAPAMPTSVKVSVGVLAGLAVLLLLSSLLTAVAWGAVVDAVADGQDSTRADAVSVVRINLAQSVVFGLLAAVSAVFLARGRAWARWSGLATGLLLGVITLGATVLAGGIAVTSQLVIVLCAAAVVSLLTRTTAAWATSGPRSRSAG